MHKNIFQFERYIAWILVYQMRPVIWRDKQNQGKGFVLESKTRYLKCILLKNSLLDFFQTYTSRRVAYLCIFLYMKSQSSEFHCSMHSIAQSLTTSCNSPIIKLGAVGKKLTHIMVSEKALLPHSQIFSRASRCQIEQ